MNENIDLTKEVKAMEVIAKALNELNDESRIRVLNWTISVVGGNVPKVKTEIASFSLGGNATSDTNSIGDFWQSKSPQSNYQKIALLGYFLEYNGSKEEFSKEDLKEIWKESREPLPTEGSFRTSVNDTLSKYKYLVSGSKQGMYRISKRGKDLVEGLPEPNKDLLNPIVKKSRGKKTAVKKK